MVWTNILLQNHVNNVGSAGQNIGLHLPTKINVGCGVADSVVLENIWEVMDQYRRLEVSGIRWYTTTRAWYTIAQYKTFYCEIVGSVGTAGLVTALLLLIYIYIYINQISDRMHGIKHI